MLEIGLGSPLRCLPIPLTTPAKYLYLLSEKEWQKDLLKPRIRWIVENGFVWKSVILDMKRNKKTCKYELLPTYAVRLKIVSTWSLIKSESTFLTKMCDGLAWTCKSNSPFSKVCYIQNLECPMVCYKNKFGSHHITEMKLKPPKTPRLSVRRIRRTTLDYPDPPTKVSISKENTTSEALPLPSASQPASQPVSQPFTCGLAFLHFAIALRGESRKQPGSFSQCPRGGRQSREERGGQNTEHRLVSQEIT